MKPLPKLLLKASFAGTFAETMLVPLYALLAQRFHGDVLDAGIGYGIFSITTGVFVALVGQTKWFENNTKSMVFWGFLVAGVCDLLYIGVQNTVQFFAVQVLLGIAIGMLNPAWDALYSEDDDENVSQAKKWSFWTGGINFVTGVSALLGAFIVATIGFKWLFVIMAACDLLAIYYSWLVWKHEDVLGEIEGVHSGILNPEWEKHPPNKTGLKFISPGNPINIGPTPKL